jgi:hypothetical protein
MHRHRGLHPATGSFHPDAKSLSCEPLLTPFHGRAGGNWAAEMNRGQGKNRQFLPGERQMVALRYHGQSVDEKNKYEKSNGYLFTVGWPGVCFGWSSSWRWHKSFESDSMWKMLS